MPLTEAQGPGQPADDGDGVLGVGAELQQDGREGVALALQLWAGPVSAGQPITARQRRHAHTLGQWGSPGAGPRHAPARPAANQMGGPGETPGRRPIGTGVAGRIRPGANQRGDSLGNARPWANQHGDTPGNTQLWANQGRDSLGNAQSWTNQNGDSLGNARPLTNQGRDALGNTWPWANQDGDAWETPSYGPIRMGMLWETPAYGPIRAEMPWETPNHRPIRTGMPGNTHLWTNQGGDALGNNCL